MQRNWIQKCLDSLLVSSVKIEVIIIDNGSTDETRDFIRKNYPQVDLITANENLGFAKANNIGIKKAYHQEADYVFLLNQDAWVKENTIEKLIEVFKELPEAGIVSPIHLNGSKTSLDFNFVSYYITQYNTPNFVSDLYFNRLQNFYETYFVNAAAWLISRKCIETVGGFDTLIFYHYGEDENYCQRVIYHGFKIYIVTTTVICHDREERKGNRPKEYEKRRRDAELSSYYGDITKDDRIVNDLKARLLRYAVKKNLNLQVKEFFLQRTMDRRFYANIKQSREQNKKVGLNWL